MAWSCNGCWKYETCEKKDDPEMYCCFVKHESICHYCALEHTICPADKREIEIGIPEWYYTMNRRNNTILCTDFINKNGH